MAAAVMRKRRSRQAIAASMYALAGKGQTAANTGRKNDIPSAFHGCGIAVSCNPLSPDFAIGIEAEIVQARGSTGLWRGLSHNE